MSRVPITIEGEIALKDELSKLKFIERPKISEAIAEARAHGDLKENAEYHAAKELHEVLWPHGILRFPLNHHVL